MLVFVEENVVAFVSPPISNFTVGDAVHIPTFPFRNEKFESKSFTTDVNAFHFALVSAPPADSVAGL